MVFICLVYSVNLEMDASINALAFVNITVAQLQILTKTLQIKLNDITAQTILLRTMCVEASGIPATVCNMIPNSSYSVVMDYSAVSVCVCVCVHVCVCVCVVDACVYS